MDARAQLELPGHASHCASHHGLRTVDLGDGCALAFDPEFARREHALWFDTLARELPWVQELYYRGGRAIPAPRLTSFHGDQGTAYVYSGIRYQAAPWTPLLEEVRARLLSTTGQRFNSALANFYRDGSDSVGWHADDEPELGPSRDDVVIASLSLGAARRFVLKHRRTGRIHVHSLGSGALLVMSGRTQREYVHAVPKTRAPVGPRINLTFRVIRR